MEKKNIGSTIESLFKETGELEEVRGRVSKRLFAEQLRKVMKAQNVSTSEMARRMGTSRPAVYRLLDPSEPGVTLDSLVRASTAVGMALEPRLVALPNSHREQLKRVRPRGAAAARTRRSVRA
jgi:transcriptional regulator with XRE-family HTH domain